MRCSLVLVALYSLSSTAAARSQAAVATAHVDVRLYDPEHLAQTTNYDQARPSHALPVRATLWEVHPITRIELFDAATGKWTSLP
jgi:hypothetical protein